MKRITRDELFLTIAKAISLRGTCQRLQVGCVIVKDNRVISMGYNGALPQEFNCDHATHGCNIFNPCVRAVHAEVNAIYFAAKVGIELEGTTLYSTHSPCLKCAEAIVQAGIKEVVFVEEFRNTDSFAIMERAGIKLRQYAKNIPEIQV